jgi:hypothetical protein
MAQYTHLTVAGWLMQNETVPNCMENGRPACARGRGGEPNPALFDVLQEPLVFLEEAFVFAL